MPGRLSRAVRPAALGYRLRELVLGPGGRTPRHCAQVMGELAVEDVCRFTAQHVLGLEATLRRLIEGRVSLARFGDGEFLSMLRPGYELYFQRSSPQLSAELRRIWRFEDHDPAELVLGFPDRCVDPHWSDVWANAWPDLRAITRTDLTYGNTHVTRPRCFRRLGEPGVDLWRRVWADQSVCVVAGTGSRFEPIPELFGSARTVSVEYAPPVDAYAEVDAIERRLLDHPADLVVLSLGPTVLAARLARRGRRALDIGHLTSSYRSVFCGEGRPEELPVKRHP